MTDAPNPLSPTDLSERELVDACEAIDADAGEDPHKEALIAEIERRGLDL